MIENALNVRMIIFDNDGVLLDSFAYMLETHVDMAKSLGLPIPPREKFKEAFGMHWKSQMIPYLWPDDHQRFCEAYIAEYQGRLMYQTFPGLVECLATLRKQGIIFAVITNRDRESTLRRLAHAGINTDIFEIITTSDDVPYRKPDPRTFEPTDRYLCERGISKSEIAYVGDTQIDHVFATEIGIHFIAIASGACSRDDFIAVGVPEHHITSTPANLIHIVRPCA